MPKIFLAFHYSICYTTLNRSKGVYMEHIKFYTKWATILNLIFLALVFLSGHARAAEVKASWYSVASLKQEGTWRFSNGIMANGRRFQDNALTCAARLYPLGARLRVTNIKNHRSVIVIVADRIGRRFATKRIDLSKGAFCQIASLRQGIINVTITKLN